jgi:DNA-binding NarL/FixJ family response regulator
MPLRILIVDDFEPWRRFVSSALQKVDSQILLEVSNGLEAVYKAEDLRPDLILLDIGLPTLNGIEAARRIRDLSPDSKILFLSEEGSPEVAEAALEAGGAGYVVKSDAGRELLPALKALSEGKRYISTRLEGRVSFVTGDDDTSQDSDRHKLQLYSSEASFLEGLAGFIADGLNSGNAVVVLATEAHRHSLIQKLQTRGFDLDAMIECGSYISVDVRETLASFMADDQPDPNQFENIVSKLIKRASKAPNGATRRVFACGECALLLWMQGKPEAALRLEELWHGVSHRYGLTTLCGYISGNLQGQEDQRIFQKICSFHSIVTAYNLSPQFV